MSKSENFIAYWLGYDEGNDIACSPASPNIVALAFGVTNAHSTIGTGFLTSKHSLADILSGAHMMQRRGQRVVLSVQGNGDPDKGWASLDPEAFAENAYDLIVNQWKLDGIDLDNEDAEDPAASFPEVIRALRARFGRDALITLPVFKGTRRDWYLPQVKDQIDAVSTMAYGADYDEQISLFDDYAGAVGAAKVAIGVANPASTKYPTQQSDVPRLAAYVSPGESKYGMMFWNLNSKTDPSQAGLWCDMIAGNLPGAG